MPLITCSDPFLSSRSKFECNSIPQSSRNLGKYWKNTRQLSKRCLTGYSGKAEDRQFGIDTYAISTEQGLSEYVPLRSYCPES